jgi:phytol kinase
MALLYNILIEIAEIVYIFAIAIAMDILVERQKISNSTARKAIHLWMGGLIVFWFLFSTQYAQLLFIIPIAIFISIMLSALYKRGPHTKIIKFVKMDNLYEIIYGPLIFMTMFIVFTIIAFRSIAGVAALCAVVFGDGVAPIAGKYACNHYHNGKKSVEGSLAFFIASLISTFVFVSLLLPGGFTVRISKITVLASVAGAVVEGITPGNFDNLAIPIAVWLIFLLALAF